jgi:1-deoxy-D-xylulose-5-phosphate reductoisomerase
VTTVSLVGSTGSIGTQAADVIRAEGDRYDVVAIGANRSIDTLAEQAHSLGPNVVALEDPAGAPALRERLPDRIELLAGPGSLAAISSEADVVVNGVVGFAGLSVTLAALEAGRRLALANKESLIAGGPVVQRARATEGAEIIPVDSEHCAVHQCLRAAGPAGHAAVRRLIITASGGPFRGRDRADLAEVTIDEALAHPTWSMGPKITIDSSTLMNKGLEVIEAHELFGVAYDDIEVVVHPQSVVHSMVEFTDGATVAQLSVPDMRLPIGYALAYPERSAIPFGAIDWSAVGHLDFEPPDLEAFPCLALAFAAGRAGELAPAWANAANEVAVAAFLAGSIGWAAISEVIAEVLDAHKGEKADSIEAVLAADREARDRAAAIVDRRAVA